ncbi:MAG: D-(-)-3-hydroxybutyrate oligomer hydrolase, partial [Betaproteobacteria bacterium]
MQTGGTLKTTAAVGALLLLGACASVPSFDAQRIVHARYDGNTDDLLTAGLGRTGLASGNPPALADAKIPTAAELRRRAVHANYRALNDMSAGGGYGTLYGPNIDLTGKDTLGEGKVAGDEYLTMIGGVTYMVQIPERFNAKEACIVTATSSGSRGV